MMKLQNVKSTILDSLLSQVAPHYCCSCGEIGNLLCESCKYDINSDHVNSCLFCGRPTSIADACRYCHSDITRMWCVGERSGGLEKLINLYKFNYAKAASASLSEVLLACLPQLPPETVIVPIPTLRAHIRQRGYDHALLVARAIAEEQKLTLAQPLERITNTVQRGTDRKQRIAQAKQAFRVSKGVEMAIPYLLIDDVVTTGATLRYAAKALKDAGATTVWAAAIARQPLD